jgi:hypothetical protein
MRWRQRKEKGRWERRLRKLGGDRGGAKRRTFRRSADLLDKSDYGSEDFADNPGKSLCVHALSSDDEDMGGTEDENLRACDRSVEYNGKETGGPTAASTPLREEMNRFRIVDTEPGESEISGINKITDATHTAAAVGVTASGEFRCRRRSFRCGGK